MRFFFIGTFLFWMWFECCVEYVSVSIDKSYNVKIKQIVLVLWIMWYLHYFFCVLLNEIIMKMALSNNGLEFESVISVFVGCSNKKKNLTKRLVKKILRHRHAIDEARPCSVWYLLNDVNPISMTAKRANFNLRFFPLVPRSRDSSQAKMLFFRSCDQFWMTFLSEFQLVGGSFR